MRTQSPREGLFCWFISARASVRGAPLPTPSREPGAELAIAPPRHVFRGPERSIPSVSGAFSPRTVTLWSRRSLSAAPTPIGVAVEVASRARIGSRPHRAHDRWEVANVFSSEVVWRVLEGFSDGFGASRRGKSRGARVLLPGDPLHISSRRASSRPPSTPGFGRTRIPSGGGPVSSPERVRPGPRRVRSRPDIDHDRFAATDARVRARGGRRAPRPGRDTSANFANVSFSDAIFFSIHRPAGDKKPKETKWTAWEEQKFFSALKVRPLPRRTLRTPAGSPSGLRSPTSRSLASVAGARENDAPLFFFTPLVVLVADFPDRPAPRSFPGCRLELR